MRVIVLCAVSSEKQAADQKASLEDQEAKGRKFVKETKGAVLVDLLQVPGFSRDYTDVWECAYDMQADGIDAFSRLLKHFELRDFDVLFIRDAARFARTQSIN